MTKSLQKVKVGDEVFVEYAWEDEGGFIHAETVTVSRILPDGQLRFRFGHWKKRTAQEQKIQAYMNQMEFYSSDVEKL